MLFISSVLILLPSIVPSSIVLSMSTPSSNLNLRHSRNFLPSRPAPFLVKHNDFENNPNNNDAEEEGSIPLDATRLIGMTRIGGSGSADISPDGKLAVFGVRDYDFDKKKFDDQLWLIDLEIANSMSESELKTNGGQHLQQLSAGSQHGWTTINSPNFSPCGDYVAFLSDRLVKEGGENKQSIWILPIKGRGEARLLREFPVSVGDLDWSQNGITVSASVYVDNESKDYNGGGDGDGDDSDPMKMTADRDEALKDNDKLGGLNAVLYKKLPIREWDRWLDAKMLHPFYFPVEKVEGTEGYRFTDSVVTLNNDLLQGAPTAVPSGAFGGSEDWSISTSGQVAVSARPPLQHDEAWTTNRHIYLIGEDDVNKNDGDGMPGKCITENNPGFDTTPTFSPDGKRLAWLTMAGPAYESDAVGIQIYDIATGVTSSLLKAEIDWDYSPNSLTWSKDGMTIYFTADVRSRQALFSIDSIEGAGEGGELIKTIRTEASTALHGEYGEKGHLLTTVQSLIMPAELFSYSNDGSTFKQLTHFNTKKIANTALGRPEEIIYKGAKNEDVQAWLIRPAGFTKEDEANFSTSKGNRFPLAVIYHGGPQGSSGDDWHYRWNLQYYASMGFAVLAPNFHGSTGFGHQFCRDISGDWGVGGEDTIAGVRAALTAHSWLDADRVVGLGASYGGFTSNWLNGNAPEGMFKSLVCHCGTFDLKSSYYATEGEYFLRTTAKIGSISTFEM